MPTASRREHNKPGEQMREKDTEARDDGRAHWGDSDDGAKGDLVDIVTLTLVYGKDDTKGPGMAWHPVLYTVAGGSVTTALDGMRTVRSRTVTHAVTVHVKAYLRNGNIVTDSTVMKVTEEMAKPRAAIINPDAPDRDGLFDAAEKLMRLLYDTDNTSEQDVVTDGVSG